MYKFIYKIKTTSIETRSTTVTSDEYERLITLDTESLLTELAQHFSYDLDADDVVEAQPVHFIEATDGLSSNVLLNRHQSNDYLAKLPESCLAYLPHNRKPIMITRGESGYRLLNEELSDVLPEEHNEYYGITRAQVNAMLHGSMFGWYTPGADPDCDLNQRIDPYRNI